MDSNKTDDEVKCIVPFKKFFGFMIPNWLAKRPEISPGAKTVYGRLCQYAGKKDIAAPKLTTLADELGMYPSRVCEYIKELRSHGLISSERRAWGTEYRFPSHPWMKFRTALPSNDSNSGKRKGEFRKPEKGIPENGNAYIEENQSGESVKRDTELCEVPPPSTFSSPPKEGEDEVEFYNRTLAQQGWLPVTKDAPGLIKALDLAADKGVDVKRLIYSAMTQRGKVASPNQKTLVRLIRANIDHA